MNDDSTAFLSGFRRSPDAGICSRCCGPNHHAFPLGTGDSGVGDASVDFDGSFIAPPFTGKQKATVFAPFTFSGTIAFPIREDPIPSQSFGANGTARVDLFWVPEGGSWMLDVAHYNFGSASTVPEPATLFLVSTAGLAVVARARRRRKS
jgi:hypothetical protein